MAHDPRTIWESYTSTWKPSSAADKQPVLAGCLAPGCTYTDPLGHVEGIDGVLGYIVGFNMNIPGMHMETTRFISHHNASIAQWNMCDADGNVMSDGISFGTYDDAGMLTSMTGFFELPDQ